MYKEGDKVIVKSIEEFKRDDNIENIDGNLLHADREYGHYFIVPMYGFCGRVAEISEVRNLGLSEPYYILNFNGEVPQWGWEDWMFKPFDGQYELF
jgi:hypothetical protein